METGTYPTPPDSPRMELAEEAVELAALAWFELLGWRSVPGDYLAPDGPMGARSDYREAILEPELRSAIASLNPDATAEMVNAAVLRIKASQSQDLVENNRLFHPFLVSGVPVEVNEKGTTRTIGIRIVDQENPQPRGGQRAGHRGVDRPRSRHQSPCGASDGTRTVAGRGRLL